VKKTFIGLLKSKTFWINAVGGGLEIVNALNGNLIPTEAAVSILMVLNIANRFLTSKPLNEK
jgi:hypothetical protein